MAWDYIYGEGYCFRDSVREMQGKKEKGCHRKQEHIDLDCVRCKYFGLADCFDNDIVVIENALNSRFIGFLCKLRHWFFTKILSYKLSRLEFHKKKCDERKKKIEKEIIK